MYSVEAYFWLSIITENDCFIACFVLQTGKTVQRFSKATARKDR